MLNSPDNRYNVKSSTEEKNNHLKQLLHRAGVELGAWALTAGFFACILWIAGNMI